MTLILSSLMEIIIKFGLTLTVSAFSVSTPTTELNIVTNAFGTNEKVEMAPAIEVVEEIEEPVLEEPVVPEPEIVEEEVQIEPEAINTFTGRLTSYTPYCNGCSPVGNVACHTQDGGKHSLINNGQVYTDIAYGGVRIIAADRTYPCGTIMKISTEAVGGTILAVVLDRGGSIKGDLFDLAFGGRESGGFGVAHNVKFEVLRLGW